MQRIRNVSCLGDLDVPVLRRIVLAGEAVDVDDDEIAAGLLQQPANWADATGEE